MSYESDQRYILQLELDNKNLKKRIEFLENALKGLDWCSFCSGGVGNDGIHDSDCPLENH